MIEKTLERIADAMELNNKLIREGLDFRKSLAGGETAAPAKEAKAPKAEKTKPEVLPEPEPEETPADDDGLGEITKADIREFYKAQDPAKAKAFFIPALKQRNALKDGKPNLDALPEDQYAEFMEAFKAAVA